MVLNFRHAGPRLLALFVSGTASAQPATLQWATSVERLQTDQAEIERRLGAGTEEGFGRAYSVGGCRVSYQFGDGGVLSIRAAVTERCHPRPERRAITPRTTLGQLAAARSSYRGQCLDGCPGHPEVQVEHALRLASAFHRIDEFGGYAITYAGDDAEAQAMWLAAVEGDPALARDPMNRVFAENPPAEVARRIASIRVREFEAWFTPTNRPQLMTPR